MADQHAQHPTITWRSLPPVRYPNEYVWMVFFAAMDVILTGLILSYGGSKGQGVLDHENEINPIARLVIEHWGMIGASLMKFALILLVIVMCEAVGRMRDRTGRMLSRTAIVISAFPVVWSLSLLLANGGRIFLEDATDRLPQPALLSQMFLDAFHIAT